MNNTNKDILIRAALNRLSARLGEKLIDTAEELTLIAKDAPDQLKKEWGVLKEEIYAEVQRIEEEENQENSNQNSSENQSDLKRSLEKIDRIRQKVVDLNQQFDLIN